MELGIGLGHISLSYHNNHGYEWCTYMHGNGVLEWVISDDAHEMISWFMVDVPLYDLTIIVA